MIKRLGLRPAGTPAQQIYGTVSYGPAHPVTHVTRGLQVAQLTEQSQESVLGQFLGIFPPSRQPQGHAEDPRLMVADEPDKGSRVPRAGGAKVVVGSLAMGQIGRQRWQFEA
jgi:hypothetical protein